MNRCKEALGCALNGVLLSVELAKALPVTAPHPFWKHFEWLLLLLLPVAYLILGLLFGLAVFKFTVAYWFRLRAEQRLESQFSTLRAAGLPVQLNQVKRTRQVF